MSGSSYGYACPGGKQPGVGRLSARTTARVQVDGPGARKRGAHEHGSAARLHSPTPHDTATSTPPADDGQGRGGPGGHDGNGTGDPAAGRSGRARRSPRCGGTGDGGPRIGHADDIDARDHVGGRRLRMVPMAGRPALRGLRTPTAVHACAWRGLPAGRGRRRFPRRRSGPRTPLPAAARSLRRGDRPSAAGLGPLPGRATVGRPRDAARPGYVGHRRTTTPESPPHPAAKSHGRQGRDATADLRTPAPEPRHRPPRLGHPTAAELPPGLGPCRAGTAAEVRPGPGPWHPGRAAEDRRGLCPCRAGADA
jgi:hypothetical protein